VTPGGTCHAPPGKPKTARVLRRAPLQLFRIALLVLIAWLLRDHAVRLRMDSLRPLSVTEVQSIFPAAAELRADDGARGGWHVLAPGGETLGYVIQTAPLSDAIIGYRGWTNALVAFTPAQRVLGVRIRGSQDTVDHVADVKGDRSFLKTWDGKSWEEAAGMTPESAGIEGVSGATMTSMAIAEGIVRRLRAAGESAVPPPAFRVKARDIGLAAIVALGIALAFLPVHKRARLAFQIIVIACVGVVNGDLLAQSLIIGWAENGVPWRTAPGLVLLLAAAMAVPWGTGRPLYCMQLCPHGHAQELIARFAPKRWRITLPASVDRALRWLAPLTLGGVLVLTFLVLPGDLAGVEPFDAWLVRTAGFATLAIAVVSLVAAFFRPMAYCHYACPTGALLNFIRGRGAADHFGRREIAAVLLVLFAWALSRMTVPFSEWIASPAADWL
jgi:NosR/NirI family transcriptional regulator, nitrous oxide reductase regulator